MHLSARGLTCATCGNDDPERILLVSEPVEYDRGIVGHVLTGWLCACCGKAIEQVLMNGQPRILTGQTGAPR
jgi:hypothetical protein